MVWETALPIASSVIGAVAGAQGTADQTKEQQVQYLPGQMEGLVNFLNASKNQYLQGPQQYYPGQTVANLDPLTIAGQNAALGTINAQQDLAQLGAGGIAHLLGGGNRVGGFQLPNQIGWGVDPALEAAVANPIYRQLEERVLPGLDLAATGQGAFGGTRQALLKGQAAANASEQATEAIARANLAARQQTIGQRAGDISAQLQGRQQDMMQNQMMGQNILAGIGAIPGINQALMGPSATMSAIGGQRSLYDQALIDADMLRWNFGQQAPQDAIDRLGARMSMAPPLGYQTTAFGTEGNLANILGGALGGLSLYNQFSGGGTLPSYPSGSGTGGYQPAGVDPGGWGYQPQYGTYTF